MIIVKKIGNEVISVRIGSSERNYSDVNKDWIIQQIVKRRKEGQSFSVEISIECGPVNIICSTPGSKSINGVPRSLRPEEIKIQKLWQKYNLNNKDFSIENLLYFLNDVGEYS